MKRLNKWESLPFSPSAVRRRLLKQERPRAEEEEQRWTPAEWIRRWIEAMAEKRVNIMRSPTVQTHSNTPSCDFSESPSSKYPLCPGNRYPDNQKEKHLHYSVRETRQSGPIMQHGAKKAKSQTLLHPLKTWGGKKKLAFNLLLNCKYVLFYFHKCYSLYMGPSFGIISKQTNFLFE